MKQLHGQNYERSLLLLTIWPPTFFQTARILLQSQLQGSTSVTVQEHERSRVQLGQNDCLRGEEEIPKENSDLSYLHNIHNVKLFIKYESHVIVPSHMDPPYSIASDSSTSC